MPMVLPMGTRCGPAAPVSECALSITGWLAVARNSESLGVRAGVSWPVGIRGEGPESGVPAGDVPMGEPACAKPVNVSGGIASDGGPLSGSRCPSLRWRGKCRPSSEDAGEAMGKKTVVGSEAATGGSVTCTGGMARPPDASECEVLRWSEGPRCSTDAARVGNSADSTARCAAAALARGAADAEAAAGGSSGGRGSARWRFEVRFCPARGTASRRGEGADTLRPGLASGPAGVVEDAGTDPREVGGVRASEGHRVARN